MCFKASCSLPTSFMMDLNVIEILVSCDNLRGITAVQVIVRVCHTVPSSLVLGTARLKAYWRLKYPFKVSGNQDVVMSLCSYRFQQLNSCM